MIIICSVVEFRVWRLEEGREGSKSKAFEGSWNFDGMLCDRRSMIGV